MQRKCRKMLSKSMLFPLRKLNIMLIHKKIKNPNSWFSRPSSPSPPVFQVCSLESSWTQLCCWTGVARRMFHQLPLVRQLRPFQEKKDPATIIQAQLLSRPLCGAPFGNSTQTSTCAEYCSVYASGSQEVQVCNSHCKGVAVTPYSFPCPCQVIFKTLDH